MIPMIEREGMSLEAFVTEYEKSPFELLHGERIIKVSTLFGHGYIIDILLEALMRWAFHVNSIKVMVERPFVLPDYDNSQWVKGSRIPDLMVYRIERYTDYIQTKADVMRSPLALVPDLVVEVVSENDVASDALAKVDLYLQDSVRMIWLVDPKKQTVWVFRASGDRLSTLHNTDMLSGEDLIEGFSLPVSALFA